MKKGFGLKKGLGLFFVMMAVVVFLAYYGATADNNPQGLAFSLKDDGTYAVEVGQAKHLSKIVIPATYKGKPVTSIDDGAFSDCRNLTSVTIGEGVTTIGDNAFSGCNSALYTEYKLGNYIGDAKNPYQVLIGVTNKNLSTYEINDRTKVIAYGAFRDCSRLTNITIPNSVKGIGSYAFYNCYGLTSVTIGEGVTTIGDWAFAYCSSLTSVTIGEGVTTIGDSAFNSCSSLTSVTIPDSVTTIGNRAFYNCDSLTSVTIGDSVTTIGDYAFSDCVSLTSVTIGDGVTTIGDWAFSWCDSLTDVYYTGSREEWADIDGNYYLTSATIHYNYVIPEN